MHQTLQCQHSTKLSILILLKTQTVLIAYLCIIVQTAQQMWILTNITITLIRVLNINTFETLKETIEQYKTLIIINTPTVLYYQ